MTASYFILLLNEWDDFICNSFCCGMYLQVIYYYTRDITSGCLHGYIGTYKNKLSSETIINLILCLETVDLNLTINRIYGLYGILLYFLFIYMKKNYKSYKMSWFTLYKKGNKMNWRTHIICLLNRRALTVLNQQIKHAGYMLEKFRKWFTYTFIRTFRKMYFYSTMCFKKPDLSKLTRVGPSETKSWANYKSCI